MNAFDEKLIEMLEKLRNGNDAVFSDIASAFSPLLVSLAAKYGAAEEYDDSLQTALVSLYSAAMSYNITQREVSFGLYAKICISNALISDARKKKRKVDAVCSLEEMTERGMFSSDYADEFDDPESRLIKSEENERLKKLAHDALSGYERQVFDLYIKGMSISEMAQTLKREEKSVNNALCRITTKLKGLLIK